VLLLAATNYYDRLDASLTRARRPEQRIAVLPPKTEEEVASIFAHYLKGGLNGPAFRKQGASRLTAARLLLNGWMPPGDC